MDASKPLIGRICEVLDLFHTLAARQSFNDAVILQLTAISLPTFFVEGVSTLQLSALGVVRMV